MAEPPPETEPRQVSRPAAERPGANTAGTFFSLMWALVADVVAAGEVLVMARLLPLALERALPPWPEIATAPDCDALFAVPTPTPVAVCAANESAHATDATATRSGSICLVFIPSLLLSKVSTLREHIT